MRIHNHHTGRRMTYGEMDEWRKARAAQQLATAGPSDAEFLVTPPLDVAALPPPVDDTMTRPVYSRNQMREALLTLGEVLSLHAEYDGCSVCRRAMELLEQYKDLTSQAQEANHGR